MNPSLEFFKKLGAVFSSLTPARKVSLLIAAIVTLASIGALVYWTGQAEYRVLFSNLSSADAGNIVNKLREKKIPYSLSPGGDAISVPTEKVAELRLELAAAGLPQGGGVGFEIFDNKTLGSTEFEQQLNYRRALEGELSRTINSLEEIQQSRVHLALPKESLFIEQRKKATASVTVRLKPGKTLRAPQVEGIAHLVASSVEGIGPEDVVIVDSSGNILSGVQGDSKLARMTSTQADYQRSVEREIVAPIQSMLENVVGKGKAVVRVSADLDFSLTEKTEEKYDPESPVVRSIKKQSEREKSDETINYEINRVVNKTVMPVGEIRKLSIAVLVDGIYTKNEKGVETYQPRAKKEIDSIEALVVKSAGINTARGDQIVVSEMPFSRVETELEPASKFPWKEGIAGFSPLIRYSAGFIAVILILMFFVRPLIKDILARDAIRAAGMTGKFPPAVTSEAGAEPIGAIVDREDRALTERELARQLAGADAKKFAEVLKTWLK